MNSRRTQGRARAFALSATGALVAVLASGCLCRGPNSSALAPGGGMCNDAKYLRMDADGSCMTLNRPREDDIRSYGQLKDAGRIHVTNFTYDYKYCLYKETAQQQLLWELDPRKAVNVDNSSDSQRVLSYKRVHTGDPCSAGTARTTSR